MKINLKILDHIQLTIDDYRDKLYDMITSKKTHIKRIQHEKLVRPSTTHPQQPQRNLPFKFGGDNHAPRSLITKSNPARNFGLQASSSENFLYNQQQQLQPRPVSQQFYPHNIYSSLESSLNTSSTISTNGAYHNQSNPPNPIQQMFNGARLNGSRRPETTSHMYNNTTTGQMSRAISVGEGMLILIFFNFK